MKLIEDNNKPRIYPNKINLIPKGANFEYKMLMYLNPFIEFVNSSADCNEQLITPNTPIMTKLYKRHNICSLNDCDDIFCCGFKSKTINDVVLSNIFNNQIEIGEYEFVDYKIDFVVDIEKQFLYQAGMVDKLIKMCENEDSDNIIDTLNLKIYLKERLLDIIQKHKNQLLLDNEDILQDEIYILQELYPLINKYNEITLENELCLKYYQYDNDGVKLSCYIKLCSIVCYGNFINDYNNKHPYSQYSIRNCPILKLFQAYYPTELSKYTNKINTSYYQRCIIKMDFEKYTPIEPIPHHINKPNKKKRNKKKKCLDTIDNYEEPQQETIKIEYLNENSIEHITDDELIKLLPLKEPSSPKSPKKTYPFKFSFIDIINIEYNQKTKIKLLFKSLYDTNEKFKDLIKPYTTIHIIKDIHYDKNEDISSLHITFKLINIKTNESTSLFHGYLKNNKINSITTIQQLL